MRGFKWALLGAALVAGGAVAQEAGQEEQQQGQHEGMGGAGQHGAKQGQQQGAMQGQQQGQQGMAMDPAQMMADFQRSNQFEIELAQLAEQRASSPQVKQMARTLIRDHEQANQRLQQMAQQANIDLPESDTATGGAGQQGSGQGGQMMHQGGQMMGQGNMMQKEQAATQLKQDTRNLLSNLQGEEFDRAFLAANVMSHDMTLHKLHMAQQMRGTPVASYAQQTLPKVKQHREHAYRLLGKMEPKAQGRRGGTGR